MDEQGLPITPPRQDGPQAPADLHAPAAPRSRRHHPVVMVERGWKEYAGECLLIVFSVILALALTEYFSRLHEQREAKGILRQLRDELITNKKYAEEQYQYHQQVFRNIDAARADPRLARQFLDSTGKLHLDALMPQGALLHDLNDVAWQEAKQNNVFRYIDISTYRLLADIYDNQERFLNLEPNLASLLISYESRKVENLPTTLTLVHDILFAWIVERTPRLVRNYQEAIDELSRYE